MVIVRLVRILTQRIYINIFFLSYYHKKKKKLKLKMTKIFTYKTFFIYYPLGFFSGMATMKMLEVAAYFIK